MKNQKSKFQMSIQELAISAGEFRNKSYQQLVQHFGIPSKTQGCKTEAGGPGKLVTWEDENYLIAVVFDDADKCLGINKELLKGGLNAQNIVSLVSLIASIGMILFGLYILFRF